MIAILDYGSQYSELIARRIREARVFSEVLSHDTSYEQLKAKGFKGIILSGGPASVFGENAYSCDPAILEGDIPVLGICYGMQLMAQMLGGRVEKGEKQEYGKAIITIDDSVDLFKGFDSKTTQVWMSHGDHVSQLPSGFVVLGHTDNCPIASFGHHAKKMYGLQFHPEVVHTPKGKAIIENFVYGISQCPPNWTPDSFVDTAVKEIRAQVGDKKVLCALSGGVDSSVVAALMHKAIGDNLTCMYINQGFMRKNETENLKKIFSETFHIHTLYIDASDRFHSRLAGVTDPEQKRKIIGEEFIRVFESETEKLAGEYEYLAQGTLYPDIIESASVGVAKTAVKIKTHHNVGGLPKDMKFKIIEPLKKLFKDEVRQVGLELGLPEELVYRHPFPGPGLAIRIIGELTKDRVKTLQDADAIMMEEIKKAGLYREIWQALTVLLPIKTVGVQGDNRTYMNTVAVRAVTSEDAMTANWAHIPYDVLENISSRIINEVHGVNRVVYDISSKPPATIEWE